MRTMDEQDWAQWLNHEVWNKAQVHRYTKWDMNIKLIACNFRTQLKFPFEFNQSKIKYSEFEKLKSWSKTRKWEWKTGNGEKNYKIKKGKISLKKISNKKLIKKIKNQISNLKCLIKNDLKLGTMIPDQKRHNLSGTSKCALNLDDLAL